MKNHSGRSLINRRKFVTWSASIGSMVPLSPLLKFNYQPAPEDLKPDLPWFKKPLTILQTVLREPDAAKYDAVSVTDYMFATGCNTLVVNGGGIVDFFRNPLPAANINPFMGSSDILMEITKACHEAGFRVIARVDFRGVEEKIFRQYPDWFSVGSDMKPGMLDYTHPRLYSSCYSGYYRNEHAREFISFLLKNYDIDGIWHNSVGVGGICHCSRCRELFKSASGEEIPGENATEEMLDRYMQWKSGMADRHMADMKKTIKSFGPDKVYAAEVFSMFESGSRINDGIDLYNARDHFDFLVSVAFLTENTEFIRYADINYAGTIVRFLKSMAPEKEAIILYGGNGTSHRYITDPAADLKVWLWEALAAGGRFWNCSFTGMHPGATYDRRSAFHQAETCKLVKEYENLFMQHVPVARIGLYYSKSTRLSFRNKTEENDDFGSFLKGMVTVLAENHIPFDFIADDQLTEKKLEKYRLIILPDVKCLSDYEIKLIKEFTARGGNLLATYETSLYSSDGKMQNDFGLADLFGCHFTGEKVNTRKDCYQYILNRDHPVVRPESSMTELLINAGFTLICRPEPSSVVITTYVPMVQNQPPEKAWTDKWAKERPVVIENTYGKGKIIYFANQPDLVTCEMGHPDMRNLLSGSIRYLAGDSIPIITDAPESVHTGLTQSLITPGEYIFSMVNTSSAPSRPLRTIVPVSNINVELNPGGKPVSYKILRSDGAYKITFREGRIIIFLEKLTDFFAMHLKTDT